MRRVMIVDDNPYLRTGLAELLAAEPDLEIVATCDGAESVALAAEVKPDVIVMDLNMPGINGVEATRRIRLRLPGPEIVILTGAPHGCLVSQALAAGARTCISKAADRSTLLAAIRDA
jgi:DNA-binding NarL/FixJ family response regulator